MGDRNENYLKEFAWREIKCVQNKKNKRKNTR